MLKWYGRPVQHTTHEHKTEDTHLESFFLVTMNHAGRPVRTHAYTKHMLAIMKCKVRPSGKHIQLYLFTRTDTHAHTFLKIIKCTRKPVRTHTHTHTSLFAMLECTGRPVRTNSHTYTHAHTTHRHNTHTHTHTHKCRGRFVRDAESAQEGCFLLSNIHMW
jgi:hypothetical protein